MHIETGQCLATKKFKAIVAPCNPDDDGQKWAFNTFDELKRKLLLRLKVQMATNSNLIEN